MISITIFLWITYINALVVFAKGRDCCSGITIEKCRRSCQELQSRTSPIPQMQVLMTVGEMCPSSETEFWDCINRNLPAVQLITKSWPGKACCEMAQSPNCRRRCQNGNSKESIEKHCREKQEPSLFSCIKNQEAGRQCCSRAFGTSCGLVCHATHLAGVTNYRVTRQVLAEHCRRKDSHVEQCVHKVQQPRAKTGLMFLPCCDKGPTQHCQSSCRSLLQMHMSEVERVDEIIGVCGEPQPTDPLWQCFLTINKSTKNETTPVTSVDNAKLQCCNKASSGRCRELCAKTYKKGWTYNAEFQTSCSYIQPVSTMEAKMHNCLTDVEQPCKPGCSGLDFCSNFNNRPTEMFRSCTPEADKVAALTFESWKKGVIRLPQLNIFVKDVSKCNPSMWKAVACALEIKPCSSKQSLITLCKEDCLALLSECADTSKLLGEQTVPVLCNALPSHGECVSLDSYLKKSPHHINHVKKVVHPCHPNPCQDGEICLLRKKKCKHPTECLPYVCHAACTLGDMSSLLVPKGSALRLVETNTHYGGDEDCFLSCECSHKRKIEGCRPLYCLNRHSCKLGHNNIKANGDAFTLDGRHCVCLSGEVICSQTSCQPDAYSPLYTGVPGNCPSRYSPVCAANGKTYPNRCIASCVGVTQIVANKACSGVDMCSIKPCPSGFRCIPRPQVCLDDMAAIENCSQFECVESMGDRECKSHHHEPVCDTTGQEHNSMCALYSHRRTLAYRGHCQDSCASSGVVCGHDGETYSSECAARAARITVDYHSKCVAFGNLTKNTKPASCSRVQCPAMNPRDCEGITPPGGCCPICAVKMVLLWSPKLLSATAENTNSMKITTGDVLTTLSTHMSLLDCQVYGYVSVNSDLIILVTPSKSHVSRIQVEACLSEGKRLHNLIKTRSPSIVSYLHLSPFVVASIETATVRTVYNSSTSSSHSNSNHGGGSGGGGNNSACRLPAPPGLALWILLLTIVLMHRKCVLRL